MPQLRTDDGPRKLRAVWLGPKGATLPFQWTYVQWLVTLISIPAVVLFMLVVLRILHVPYPIFWAGPWGTAAAMYGSVKLMRHVTYDEPLKYVVSSARNEWRESTRHDGRSQRIGFDMPEVQTLAEPMLRRMGWNDPGQLGLGRAATRIVAHVRRNGDRYALDLMDELKLDWQTVDAALNELEAFGLLVHRVTPAGRALYIAPAQQRYHLDRVETKKTWRQRLLRR